MADKNSPATQRQKSPNYPSIGLDDALDKIHVIYAKEGTNGVDADAIAKSLGFTGITSGHASGMVSSLKKYNLLENIPKTDRWKLSHTAIDLITLDAGDEPRLTALQTAALAPPLFKSLHDDYQWSLPSDNALTNDLLKRKFSTKGAQAAISAIKKTWEFVNSQQPTTLGEGSPLPQASSSPAVSTGVTPCNETSPGPSPQEKQTNECLNVTLPKGNEVKITFSKGIGIKSIEQLIKYLKICKDDDDYDEASQ